MRQIHSIIAFIPLAVGCSVHSPGMDATDETGHIDTGDDVDIGAERCCCDECFSPEMTLEFEVPLVGALLVGDYDGDGDDDLASGAGIVLLNDHGFGLAAPIDLGTTNDQILRFVADINGDGRSDLVGKQISNSALIVFLAHAQAGFEPPEFVDLASSEAPDGVDLFAEDFDGDGRDEVAVFTDFGRTLKILRRNGKDDWSTLQIFESSLERWVLTGGLVDGDEHVDLVAVAGTDTQVHFGRGDGSFTAPEIYFAGAEGVGVPFSSPVDAGLRGIAYTGEVGFLAKPSAGIVVLWANPTGITGQGFETNWPTDAIAVGDLQGDGFGDVVAVTDDGHGEPMLAVLCGSATNYTDCDRVPLDKRPLMLGMLDVDANGQDDVVYVGSEEHVLHVLLAKASNG